MTPTISLGDWVPAIRTLPEGHAVAAIGDVHGHDDLFSALLDAIGRQLDGAREAVFVQLGDLVDRGPASVAALDRARRGIPGVTSVTIKGNHEDRMLRAVLGEDPAEERAWLDFGGRETIRSAGVDPDDADYPARMRGSLGAERLAWVAGLPSSHRVGDVLFVHAGIDPNAPLAEQSSHTLMWTRKPWLDSFGPYDQGVAVIHGHTPTLPVELSHPHRVNLDTGAFRTGLLTGLVIREDRMRLVHAAA